MPPSWMRCGGGRGTERLGAGAPRPGTFCVAGGGTAEEGVTTFPDICHCHRCPQRSRTHGLCRDSLPAPPFFAGRAEARQPPNPCVSRCHRVPMSPCVLILPPLVMPQCVPMPPHVPVPQQDSQTGGVGRLAFEQLELNPGMVFPTWGV